MAIQKDIDTKEGRSLKARLNRSFTDASGRGAGSIFKEKLYDKTNWMRDEPGLAFAGVPIMAGFSFLLGAFAGTAIINIDHINNEQDTAYQYDITAGAGEMGYVGFEHNQRGYALTFDDGQFDLFEASYRHPREVMLWQRDPGDALDRLRTLKAAIVSEIESLETGAVNDDISIVAFEQLSPFHQNLDAESYERNFEGMVTPADGMNYAQRLEAALILIDEAEEFIVTSTYGQQDPDVPVQEGPDDALKIGAIFPALVLLLSYGFAPVSAGIGTAAQLSTSRRRKQAPKL